MADEPEWWRTATFYQIYPRSFQDTTGDGVGDLPGITERLAYVADLGVDGIWISPFFASPMKDFGYDVSDYRAVDPLFGGLADFDGLLARAHSLGLKVLIDQVWSHTSDQHAWFAESRCDRTNARAEWYVWADPRPDGTPPNNWQAWFGGPAWSWEAARGQYYLHNFLPEQPDLNFRCPEVRESILDVARFWLERGVDGFRLDVANYYFHDAALADNPPRAFANPPLPVYLQRHVENANRPETLAFLPELRAVADEYGAVLLGELANVGHRVMQDYTRVPDRLHTAYGFELLRGPMDAAFVAKALAAWPNDMSVGWPSWALSNHDVDRVATRWAGSAHAEAAPMLMALLLCLRGTPFLYQGEELGLPQVELAREDLRDPAGIAGWPRSKGRDGERTPMPWTSAPGAGFGTARPWLPIPEAHRCLSVERQNADASSMLATTRRLLALRRAHPALRVGTCEDIRADGDVLSFHRVSGDERVFCRFNLGEAPVPSLADAAPLWSHRRSDDTIDPLGAELIRG